MKDEKTKTHQTQHDRFLETARELECDEDEDRFNETLKRLAPKKDEAEADQSRLQGTADQSLVLPVLPRSSPSRARTSS